MSPSHSDHEAGITSETATITADALSAWQWEAHLALSLGHSAWHAKALGYRAWTEELWSSESLDPGRPALLSRRQGNALWRRVVAESPEGDELLGTAGTAAWAEDAWRRVHAWQLDDRLPRALEHEHDYAAFLRWRRDYAERLRDNGWIDAALLNVKLTGAAASLRPRAVELADLDPEPSQHAFLESLRAFGWSVGRKAAPTVAAVPARRRRCADPHDELEEAARWAVSRLGQSRGARVAIIVPDLERRISEVRRTLTEGLAEAGASLAGEASPGPAPTGEDGPPPIRLYIAARDDRRAGHSHPLVGAAVNALELISPYGTLEDLGRWLRSPFFQDDDPREIGGLARLEAALRADALSQLSFIDAYRRGGLRNRIAAEAPGAAARLDAALLETDDGPAARTPAAWCRMWSRVLQRLGWRGWRRSGGAEAGDLEQRHFEAALRDFAMLTPIVGTISGGRALAELDASLRRTIPAPPVPLSGVHVLPGLGALGPGYRAAWITGATDSALPVPARVNPLLPRRLQVEAGMPWSSPDDALTRSGALIEEAVRRVPECLFSWPARDGEQEHEPSPLLASVTEDTSDEGRAAPPVPAPPLAAPLELVPDQPPPLPGSEVRGGTAALNAQSASPLRAFCEFRLGAAAIEPFPRGIPPRLRGIATHAALERFFRIYDSRAALAASTSTERRHAATRCAWEALARVVAGGAVAPLAALLELERDRIALAIERLADKEVDRADFRVDRLEQRASLELRGRTLALRIDRVDVLGTGEQDAAEGSGLAVIDYKTGRGQSVSGWFRPRPGDVQLPAYALALRRVTALAVATLRGGEARYAGLWPKGTFPGRSAAVAVEECLDAWERGIGDLIDEYADGDTRFFADDPAPAAGAYAPLTRVHEQLALHRRRRAREGS